MSESQKLCNDVSATGIEIKSIYDLVSSKKSYASAIPILIESISNGISDISLKEGVVRALGASEARGTTAGQILIKEYRNLPVENGVLRRFKRDRLKVFDISMS